MAVRVFMALLLASCVAPFSCISTDFLTQSKEIHKGIPEDELYQMLVSNAAQVYGLDLGE